MRRPVMTHPQQLQNYAACNEQTAQIGARCDLKFTELRSNRNQKSGFAGSRFILAVNRDFVLDLHRSEEELR